MQNGLKDTDAICNDQKKLIYQVLPVSETNTSNADNYREGWRKSHSGPFFASLTLFGLFSLSLTGHAISGWMAHNAEQRAHQEAEVPLTVFLGSSEFGETVFENWESEFLQMAFYVILTVFLYQRGSAESKKHDGTDKFAQAALTLKRGNALCRVVRLELVGDGWSGSAARLHASPPVPCELCAACARVPLPARRPIRPRVRSDSPSQRGHSART
jgi:hypothetical protein